MSRYRRSFNPNINTMNRTAFLKYPRNCTNCVVKFKVGEWWRFNTMSAGKGIFKTKIKSVIVRKS